MCATVCPVHIDTGAAVRRLRAEAHPLAARRRAEWLADRMPLVERTARLGLRLGHAAEALFGTRPLAALARGLGLPTWSAAFPRAPRRPVSPPLPTVADEDAAAALYLPSCLARIAGRPRDGSAPLGELLPTLARRAAVPLRVPPDCEGQCCGLPFGSKGYAAAEARVAARLVERLWSWSGGGRLPIVIEASSCVHALREAGPILDAQTRRRHAELRVLDAVEYARDVLLPRLHPTRLARRVALHPSCALRRLGLDGALAEVASRCAAEVVVPRDLACCGTAGDRGLRHPELPAAALADERAEVLAAGCDGHYASNLGCEIGLDQATGLRYRSFLYLLEEASR
jgi:D-lactate dehydrogenase